MVWSVISALVERGVTGSYEETVRVTWDTWDT